MEGDTNPWRSVGHTTWYDSLAILEDPTSDAFKTTVQKETDHWKRALKPYSNQVNKWESLFQTIITKAMPAEPEYANEVIDWQTYSIHIQHASAHRLNVWFMKDTAVVIEYYGLTAFDVDRNSDLYAIIEDIGSGSETLRLSVYQADGSLLWAKDPVGPNSVFQSDCILYQTVENQLRYPGILSAKKYTGKGEKKVFEEVDKRFQVELIQPAYQSCAFLKIENALSQRIGQITNESVQWITNPIREDSHGQGITMIPISNTIYGTDTDIVFESKKYSLMPNEFLQDAICFGEELLFTTTHKASMSLYVFNLNTKQMKRLYSNPYPCEITLRKLATIPTIEIGYPHKASQIYQYVDHTLRKIVTFPQPLDLELRHGFANSKDGTKVPYTLVFEKHTRPSKLFVEGYGSYGISCRRTYPIQKLAWIKRGYAYAVSFARGGREDGDRWYNGGRTAQRKQNTFDDTAAVIKTIQDSYNFKPASTVFYGRSAGGLLAGNIAHQYPHLVGTIYAEVPYLDVLRTTTNPDLPLTQLEYDEFGDPAHRPADFKSIQQISPVDTVPYAEKKSPLIIVKTALNDSQVLPYETLKWANKLRANNWSVYVGIDHQGGHFVKESKLFRSLAEDATLITKYGKVHTRRRRRHSSRGTIRRRTSSLKH